MYRFWQFPFFILHDLTAMVCMTAVLATTRGFRERKRPVTVGCFLFSAALSAADIALLPAVSRWTDPDTGILLYGALSLLPILVFPQVVLRSSRHFSSALICLAINVGMEGLFSVLGFLLEGKDRSVYHFYETLFCAAGYALVTLFLLYASRNKDLKIIRSTVELIPKWLYAVIIICSFSSFFSVMGREPGLYDFEKLSGVLRALSVFGVILFSGYFVFKVFALMATQNRFLLQLNAQQQNYERMLHSDEQLRQFRHDYKNHMLVVTSLLNAGLTDEAKDYLDQIKVTSGMSEERFRTGNIVVDAILNNKRSLAEAFDIELTFSGSVPETCIEPADLCTVIGNMVDNAIEGAKRCPGQRYIRMKAVVRGGFLTLSAVNTVAQKVTIRNNRIRTTKADAANHGIGLKNVAAVAKKYHGGMLLSCDEKEFTIDVTMRLTEE